MELKDLFNKYDIEVTDKQIDQFNKYMNLLLQENEKFNLTAIKDTQEIYVKHFLDSVLPNNIIDKNAKVVDIGTGAGFPSIPIAILRDDLDFTLIDSVEKKIKFVNLIKAELGLENIQAIHARCEELAKKVEFREQFDCVVARAVAPMSSLIEYSVPFLKCDGKFIAYKGTNVATEIENSKNAIKLLHIQQVTTLKYVIDEIGATRYCVIFKKVQSTPKKYPRGQNKVKFQPLN